LAGNGEFMSSDRYGEGKKGDYRANVRVSGVIGCNEMPGSFIKET